MPAMQRHRVGARVIAGPLRLASRTVELRAAHDGARDDLFVPELAKVKAWMAYDNHITDHAVTVARSVVSLPSLVSSWRAVAADHRAQGDELRAEAIERCAAQLEAAIGADPCRR